MNWEQAKTILIVAFLGLNLYLGYLVWEQNLRYPTGAALVTSEEVAAVEQRLQEAGVELRVPIPREAPALPLLRVEMSPVRPYDLAREWFGGDLEGVTVERAPPEDGSLLFTYQGQELEVQPDRAVSFRDPQPGWSELDAEQAQEWGAAYQERMAARGQELRLEEVRPAGDEAFQLEFRHYFQNHPLVGRTGARARLHRDGPLVVWHRWVSPRGPSGEERSVLPATEALLRLLSRWEEDPAGPPGAIDEIVLGFYNNVYDAREWEAVPVWAVRVASGDWYYVNAYTGVLES